MKKNIWIIFLILIIVTGCHPSPSKSNIKEINNITMVPIENVCNLLQLTYMNDGKNISLKQDSIILNIDLAKPYVYKDGYIQDVLEHSIVTLDNIVYIPLSFFTDYLGVEIVTTNNNEFSLIHDDFSLYNVVKYLPAEIVSAIDDENYPYRDKILNAVELPKSMDIEIPKINMDKIISTTPLDAYAPNFKEDLRQHGYTDEEIANFAHEDYNVIASTWKLSEYMIKSTKSSYPELQSEDLSSWTYGDLHNYNKYQETLNAENYLTEEQKEQFVQKGILLEDIPYLLKDFHQIDTILTQPDEILKETIAGYYQFSINMLRQ